MQLPENSYMPMNVGHSSTLQDTQHRNRAVRVNSLKAVTLLRRSAAREIRNKHDADLIFFWCML